MPEMLNTYTDMCKYYNDLTTDVSQAIVIRLDYLNIHNEPVFTGVLSALKCVKTEKNNFFSSLKYVYDIHIWRVQHDDRIRRLYYTTQF